MNLLDYCIEKAKQIPYVKGQYRLYSVITDKRGRIVSESANSYCTTHPKQFYAAKKVGKPLKQFLHAESAALIKSKGRGCKLYVARVLSDGTPADAMPCIVCRQMLKLHGGIKSVEYTTGE